MEMPFTLDKLTASFVEYLQKKDRAQWKKFLDRLKNDTEAARTEAAVFRFLKSNGYNIELEDISKGGPDFICSKDGARFAVEVTSLKKDTIEKVSGIKKDVREANGGWFKFVTNNLWSSLSRKASKECALPLVVAISTEHHAGDVLLGPMNAKEFFTGKQSFSVELNNPKSEAKNTTHLEGAAFFRFNLKTRKVELARENISAVLLVHLCNKESRIVGLLHPKSVRPFSISWLPNVPFLRLKAWPPQDGLDMEWTISKPEALSSYYFPIEM